MAEEIIIEEQTIEELREQIKVLQEELVEQKRHADKMEELAWEIWKEKKGLQTKLDNLKSKLLGSLFQNKKESSKIKELKVQRVRLKAELIEKEQQITDLNNTLNNQIGQLTIQKNGLNEKLNVANDTIAKTQNSLGINNLNNLPTLLGGETLVSLLARPTSEQLRQKEDKINELAAELEKERGWWDKWERDENIFNENKPLYLKTCYFSLCMEIKEEGLSGPELKKELVLIAQRFYRYYLDK